MSVLIKRTWGRIVPRTVEEEYKKTGIKPEEIAVLRRWVNTQPHLPHEYITDLDLLLSYHCCYKCTEVSKQVLDLHYTLKTLFSNLFKDRAVNDALLKAVDFLVTIQLEQTAYDNSCVVYCRLIDTDPKKFNFLQAARLVLILLDLSQYEEGTWPGVIMLIDLAGVSLGHLAKVDLQVVQQLLYFLQEAILVRLKGVHFLNAPSFIDRLMMMIKPFLKPELMKILEIHSIGSKKIEKYVPLTAMPRDVGGEGPSFEETKAQTFTWLRSNADFFELEGKKRVKESLRPGKPKTITDIFHGVEGSFKKLDID